MYMTISRWEQQTLMLFLIETRDHLSPTNSSGPCSLPVPLLRRRACACVFCLRAGVVVSPSPVRPRRVLTAEAEPDASSCPSAIRRRA